MDKQYLKLGKIFGLAQYILIKGYPICLFDERSYLDDGEWDQFGNVDLHIVESEEYTDVLGLSKQEFNLLLKTIDNIAKNKVDNTYYCYRKN